MKPIDFQSIGSSLSGMKSQELPEPLVLLEALLELLPVVMTEGFNPR